MRVMSSARSQVVNSDQDMTDGMAELELQKLQRQYRIMEGDRKAYSEESRVLINKQRTSIEKLKRDNIQMVDELRLSEHRTDDKKRNGELSKKAGAFAEQSDLYQKKIRLIATEISALDNAINVKYKEIDDQRASLGGVHAASQNNDAIQKQIRVLENRLDKALVKFNNALAVNKSLRASIDNLRRERLVFDTIYRKFERDVMEQKKQMADIIENSNAAYEARDEAQAKIIALREKAEKENQNYVQEMKELDRTLEQDRKLKEFMAAKISDRSERADVSKESDLKPLDKDASNTAKFASSEGLAESLESYEKAFENIRKVTNITDIGELVQKFKEVEDQNFSLFNFVNEINNEIEMEAEGIVSVQRRIDGLKIENIEAEEKRAGVMKGLESEITECDTKVNFYTNQITKNNQLLEELKQAIETLQSSAQIPKTESEDAEKKPVEAEQEPTIPSVSTDFDILGLLGQIEQKTNDLLTLHLAVNAPKNRNQIVIGEDGIPKEVSALSAGNVGGLLGQGPSAPLSRLAILAPSTMDEDDNLTDEDERPLTREEILAKTLKGISKKAEKSVITATKTVVTKAKRKGKRGD